MPYSWREARTMELAKYAKVDDNLSQYLPKVREYVKSTYDSAIPFCKTIISLLGKGKSVLDLGGGRSPPFSYAFADCGATVTTFDILDPLNPELLKEKNIRYVRGDINDLSDYNLGKFDFIFCRGLSPAQCLINWYDPEFISIWKQILNILNSNGVIYWMQMTNGMGKPDPDRNAFANHTRKYFVDFFKQLGIEAEITKYGYMCFKITKQITKEWSRYHISTQSYSEELHDAPSLMKNYALQLQMLYENMPTTIELCGPFQKTRMVQTLLEDNFHFNNINVNEANELFLNGMELTDNGMRENDYFLIDGTQDRRFTDDFLSIYKRYTHF